MQTILTKHMKLGEKNEEQEEKGLEGSWSEHMISIYETLKQ